MDDDDHIVLEENIIIEEEEESMHAEPEPEKIVKLRDSADDDVLQVGVEDEGLDDEREVIEEGSVEDGEIEEEQKKSHKTLRVHLPDLLQGIDNDDEDPFITSENIEKLEKRAKRFNMENDLSVEDCNRVLRSLDIPVEERELRAQGRYKLDCIEMFGVFGVGEADLKDYFGHYLFEEVSFPEDDIGIVRFRTDINAFRAMMKFSKPVGEPRKEERIIKHVLTADGSPERKVITKDVKDEFDKMVHPDDLPEERPEGKWRYGIKSHKKRDYGPILMRFPLKAALKKGHYLQNDRSARGSWKVQPPADIELIEEEEKLRRKNFDKKNPWADLSESWSNATRNATDREYEIDLADLDHPPRRLATGLRDWDNPENPHHAVQIRSRESRKRKLSDDMDEGPETFFEEEIPDSAEDGEADSDTEEEWKKKLKRPRLGMVADMEEKKQKVGIKGRLLGGQGAAKRLKTSGGPRIKRKISNHYIVSEKIIVESSEEDELNDPDLLEEAKNEDLRHHLTMRVENNKQTNRPILKATKRLSNRFAGPDSDEDDRGGAFENMKIQIRADDSSDQDERMDVDDEHTDARAKLKKRREAKENLDHKRTSGDLRDRMSRDRKSADSDRKRERRHDMDVETSSSRRDKVRSPVDDLRKRMTGKSIKVKNEFEEERRKEENKRGKDKPQNSLDDERREIDERMRELKDVKAQEKELLDKLNNKLKKMEQEKEELRRSKDRAPVRSADKGRRSPAIVADKSRRSPAVSATKDRRRRKSPEPVRQSRRKASPAKKRRKNRSPSSSSSSSSDYSSSEDSDSGSDSDDSDSDDSDSSSSSSSGSDDSSSSSSSSDSDSSSDGNSEPQKKKKYKSSSSRSKKDQKTSSSSSATKRKHATSSSSKKSSKPDIKEEKKSTKDSEKEKKPSSSSGKPTLEDKKKDADLKAKLENFVNKSKSKKDKK